MAQVWIDIEENENCGYHPLQTFESQGVPQVAASVVIEEGVGVAGAYEVVGWCSDRGGSPCDVTVIVIGDSGAGRSRLVMGGDNGVRLRPAGTAAAWSLASPDQRGEPYILLRLEAPFTLLAERQ
jgi:hypothetical protein